MYAKKNSTVKVVVTLLAVALLIIGAIGGTLAWLMDSTDSVKNTFTAGKVEISLKETPYSNGTYGTDKVEGQDNEYPAIPGATYKKDPTVAVEEGSEDCYLFVEFKYTPKAEDCLNYKSNLTAENGWKQIVTSEPGTEVWYRVVYKTDEADARSFDLLAALGGSYGAGITLEIDPTYVTNDTMAIAEDQELEWNAYAVQFNYLKDATNNPIAGDTVEAATKAWTLVYPGE